MYDCSLILYFTDMAPRLQMTTRKRKLADLKCKETSIELQTECPHELPEPDEGISSDEASAQEIVSKRRCFFEQLGNNKFSMNHESLYDGHIHAETVDDPFDFKSEHEEAHPFLSNENENITGICLIFVYGLN